METRFLPTGSSGWATRLQGSRVQCAMLENQKLAEQPPSLPAFMVLFQNFFTSKPILGGARGGHPFLVFNIGH